jgi:hypothetical protein
MGEESSGKIRKSGEKEMIKKILYTFLSLVIILAAGCGYTTRSMVYSEYRTIYIAPFANKVNITQDSASGNKYKIYRPMLETEVTRAVNNKYLFDGNLKPVSKESADVLLKGELVDFRRDPLRYTDDEQIYEYRINIVVNIGLWNNKTDQLIWQENNFTGDFTYFVSGPNAKSEGTAVNDAIADLARRIVERTVEQW